MEKELNLKDWALLSMSPEKAKCFLEYFRDNLYIIKDNKLKKLEDKDLIPERYFKAYKDDFDRCMETI
jgi:hypothetical protein